jgi:hypothetical protein
LKLQVFSREAAAADSCGRQPAVSEHQKNSRAAKRRQQFASRLAVAASRLLIPILSLFRGLTPTAICYRRFAAPENAQLQKA